MAKLDEPVFANLYPLLKPTLDVYWDSRTGLIARSWPRYNAPERTPAWQQTQINLKNAWATIKSLPPEFIENYKSVARSNSTRSAYDLLRSVIMSGQPGSYTVARIIDYKVHYDDEIKGYVLDIAFDPRWATDETTDYIIPSLMYAKNFDQLVPIWRQYPTPYPYLCRSLGKFFPLWALHSGIIEGNLAVVTEQHGILNPVTHGFQKTSINPKGTLIQSTFKVEDSFQCGGSNMRIQHGAQIMSLEFEPPIDVELSISAYVETQNPEYDEAWILLEDAVMAHTISTEEGGQCERQEKHSVNSITLLGSPVTLNFGYDTIDPHWHKDIYAEYMVHMEPHVKVFYRYILKDIPKGLDHFHVLPYDIDTQGRTRILSGVTRLSC